MILYIDASAGLSSDMLLAGLIDLGLPLSRVRDSFRLLGLPVPDIRVRPVFREGTRALQVFISSASRRSQEISDFVRRPAKLIRLVRDSRLPPGQKRLLIRALRLLTQAEAGAHGVPAGKVVLHQIAGPDTLAALAGFAAGLDHFQVQAVHASPVPVGSLHKGPHGKVYFYPGPAASRLLQGFRVRRRPERFEWTTPTGALFLSAFGLRTPAPALRIIRSGSSVGHGRPPSGPSILHLLLGEVEG